ncbi:YtxH domain-containing protein [Metabacillus arenae]|uniref:YtxH domain-containing protein n=1 Tax=Metabacillus arenae TaxID=2771434 RepID=A0A926NK96_9BACI|nr:YtxH domain-containing protein [Metabacillus arenae]MBD1379617.1 YtxH domain-containing protein [Metabacillus arenae]
MSNENRLVKNMVIGAAIGALVSLFHKPTRDQVIRQGKEISEKTIEFCKDPSKLTNEVKEKVEEVRKTIDEVSGDVAFVNEKFQELRKTTPQVLELIEETKERFSKKE